MLEKTQCGTYVLTSPLEGSNPYTAYKIAGNGTSLEVITTGNLASFQTKEFVFNEDGAYVIQFNNTSFPVFVFCKIEQGILNLMKELLCSAPCNEKGQSSIRAGKLYYYNAAMLSFQTFLMMLNEQYYSNPPFQGQLSTTKISDMFCVEQVLDLVTKYLECASLLTGDCNCGC